jgi:uncharacterized protein (TIGR03000 family)
MRILKENLPQKKADVQRKKALQAMRNSCRKEEECVKKAFSALFLTTFKRTGGEKSPLRPAPRRRGGAVMTMTRSMTWLAIFVLPLLLPTSVQAQTWFQPVYGPWGVYYVPYYPALPAPMSPPAIAAAGGQPSARGQTTTASAQTYAAPPSDSDQRPSYYSEDYAGPQGPSEEPSKVAYIRVRVPANAELWINNDKRAQRGTIREFVTPALDPDSIYVYNVKARWTDEGGIEVQKTLRVRTIAGTRVTVNFVRPPESQPRPAAPATVRTPAPVATARPVIQQQPVSWTSGNVAPRSFRGAGAP